MAAKLADSTRQGYDTGWKHWTDFCKVLGKSPFLEGETKAELREDEDLLLLFVSYLSKTLSRTEGTIKQKLFAIKFAHTVAGLPDPLKGRVRLWAALGGILRWQGAPQRRHPIMPEQLEWLAKQLPLEYAQEDAAALWAMVNLGWHFLLRSAEYLPQGEGGGASWSRVLHGVDVEPRRNGKRAACFRDADEIVIYIKGSKTDQYNVGTTRNHHRAGGLLCPVEAMANYEFAFPGRLGEALPLARYGDGKPIRREHIQQLLEQATIATGGDPGRIGTHSLRIGGATALYHTVQDLAYVQRFGRWASDAYHVYLWDSHELTKGLASKMAQAKGTLTTPKPARLPREGAVA